MPELTDAEIAIIEQELALVITHQRDRGGDHAVLGLCRSLRALWRTSPLASPRTQEVQTQVRRLLDQELDKLNKRIKESTDGEDGSPRGDAGG